MATVRKEILSTVQDVRVKKTRITIHLHSRYEKISNTAGVIIGKMQAAFQREYFKNNTEVRVNQEYDCKMFFLF
jgi:hypothetical protein